MLHMYMLEMLLLKPVTSHQLIAIKYSYMYCMYVYICMYTHTCMCNS